MEAVTGSIFGICLSAGGRRKSAGTVRKSRRRSAKRGRGREPPTDTDGLPAVTPEVRLEYLREQIYCLQSR